MTMAKATAINSAIRSIVGSLVSQIILSSRIQTVFFSILGRFIYLFPPSIFWVEAWGLYPFIVGAVEPEAIYLAGWDRNAIGVFIATALSLIALFSSTYFSWLPLVTYRHKVTKTQ